jgi:hypothetical protein
MERYRPRLTRTLTPAERKRLEAEQDAEFDCILRVLSAYSRIEDRKTALEAAREQLRDVLLEVPKAVLEDHRRFYAAGGCTAEHYKEWIRNKNKTDQKPAKRRKRLRLVSQDKYRQPALTRLRQRSGEGPEVAWRRGCAI